MRLFLCDDNAQYRMLARTVLETEHEIVGEAGDGLEAIERAPGLRPDVVLLDLNMPLLDGHQSIPRLRDLLPDARLVVLTSGRAADERERALAAGADGFMLKPESVYTLNDALAAALAGPPTGSARPIRVLICDDAAAFSILATHWIDSAPDLEAVGTVHSGPELLEVLGSVAPDVVVLDHLLGGMDSEELTPQLRAEHPGVGVVLVSGMPSDALADIATRSGVDASTSKATRPDDFCDAVRRAAKRVGGGDGR